MLGQRRLRTRSLAAGLGARQRLHLQLLPEPCLCHLPGNRQCGCRCADLPEQFQQGQYPPPPLATLEGPLTDVALKWWEATQGLLPAMQ